MSDSNPDESTAVEGLPDEVEDLLPGKDVDTMEEAAMLPRDHSIASGSDPAYPVTVHEQVTGESVAERAASEQPEVGEAADGAAREVLALDTDGDLEELDVVQPGADPSPEEAALHIERH